MYYKLPTLQTKAKAIILANGSFPTHSLALSILLKNKEKIICCDGAINNLKNIDIIPHAIVGDCDSLSEENKSKYEDIIYRVNEQNTNDLTKTITFCKDRSVDHIIILGATGKREDHTIANISLLADYIDIIEDICMITDYGIFNSIKTTSKFESFKGQQVSIFNMESSTISSKGLKFPIEKINFSKWWEATLNESCADNFEIETNGKLILYRAF